MRSIFSCSQVHLWTKRQTTKNKQLTLNENLPRIPMLRASLREDLIQEFISHVVGGENLGKWLVSFCLQLDFGCIIMRDDGSFKNEFPDVQVDFKKYEKFKKSILILMLIFLVWLKNCNLLFFNNSFNLLFCTVLMYCFHFIITRYSAVQLFLCTTF